MARMGVTTGNLKLRSGPGMQYEPPLDYLIPNTEMEILEEVGADWLHVKVGGKEGYVGRKYVDIKDAPAPAAGEMPPDQAEQARKRGGLKDV